jgi:hypothetical protein
MGLSENRVLQNPMVDSHILHESSYIDSVYPISRRDRLCCPWRLSW